MSSEIVWLQGVYLCAAGGQSSFCLKREICSSCKIRGQSLKCVQILSCCTRYWLETIYVLVENQWHTLLAICFSPGFQGWNVFFELFAYTDIFARNQEDVNTMQAEWIWIFPHLFYIGQVLVSFILWHQHTCIDPPNWPAGQGAGCFGRCIRW